MPDDMVLEPTTPAPPAPAVDPTPQAPPPVDPSAAVDPDEAQAIDLPSGKHVPLAVAKALRTELKATKATADKVQQLEQWVAQNKPYVDFIQQNQHLLRQPQPAAQPQQPTADDPALESIAQSLDFMTPDGKPDLARAKRHQQLIRAEAVRIAQEVVAPIAVNTYTDQANRNWHAAVQEKLPNGQTIDANLLRTAWIEVGKQNPASLADPRAVRVIVNNVMAEQWRSSPLSAAPNQAPLPPPVPTEGIGPKPTNQARMNDTQRAIVASRGIDDKKFHDLTQGFQPGRMNPLED